MFGEGVDEMNSQQPAPFDVDVDVGSATVVPATALELHTATRSTVTQSTATRSTVTHEDQR